MSDREKTSAILEWLTVLLPVLLSPLFLFPKPQWLWLVTTIPLFWLLKPIVKGRSLEPSPLNMLILFLLIMTGVSLYATFDVQFSLAKVTGTLLGICVFLGMIQFANTERRFNLSLTFFLMGGFALGVIALVGTAWSVKFSLMARIVQVFPTRFKSLPGAEEGFNANAVGGTLSLFFPLAIMMVAYFLRPGNRLTRFSKWAFAGAVLLLPLMAGVLLLSQSRGAWLGTCLGLGLLLLPVSRWIRWPPVAGGGIAAVLVVILKPWIAWIQGPGNRAAAGGDFTMAVRVEIWSRAICGIQDFPFTGMGMNAFRKVVNVLYSLFSIPPDVDIAHCHNQLLQTALDLGIPGLVAYAGIWAATFGLLWRVHRKSQDPFRRMAALGLAGGLLAQFVFGINDAIALGAKVGIFWWIALALAVSLSGLEGQGSRTETQGTKTSARAWELPLLWILLSLVSISFVGDHPYLALGIAILGGTYLGIESIRNGTQIRADPHGFLICFLVWICGKAAK